MKEKLDIHLCPRSYGICTKGGCNIVKSKGFYLNYADHQIFNFNALKQQVIARACEIPIENLVLNEGETLMTATSFALK